MTSQSPRRSPFASVKLLALSPLFVLVACGSGGDAFAPAPAPSPSQTPAPAPTPAPTPAPAPTPSPSPAPSPAPAPTTDPKAAAGFWSGRLDAQTTVSSVFLPEGQAWTILISTPSASPVPSPATASLARGTVSVANAAVSVAGSSYSFGSTPTVSSYSLQGALEPQSKLSVAATAATPAYALAYSKSYELPARLADAASRWNATAGQGAIRYTLDIGITGVISGNSTAGCAYTGSLVAHPAGIAVFNLSLQEQCLNQAATSLSGIATLNSTNTQLTLAFTTANGSQAGLLLATR